MSEIELILSKLKIVSEEKENGMYLCDKEHSKILLDYIQQKENIIKEVREILKFHLSNPSGIKNGWHIDIWNSEDISKLNEDLGILDKGE